MELERFKKDLQDLVNTASNLELQINRFDKQIQQANLDLAANNGAISLLQNYIKELEENKNKNIEQVSPKVEKIETVEFKEINEKGNAD